MNTNFDQKQPVFCAPDTQGVIDFAIDNGYGIMVSEISGKNLEELSRDHPNVFIDTYENALKRQNDSAKKPPAEITEEDFLEKLNVLPPVNWVRNGHDESFRISELLVGDIAAFYVRVGARYFSFADSCRMRHTDAVSKVMSSSAFNAVNDQSDTLINQP